MSNRILSAAVLAVLAVGFAGSASAATNTDTLDIQATVINQCEMTIQDALGLEISALSSGHTFSSPGGLDVRCNTGTAYSVEPGQGANWDWLPDYPGMRNIGNGAGNYVAYQMFQDAMGGNPWDIGSPIIGIGNGDWVGHDFSLVFYGQHKAPGGSYADQVLITNTYN